MVCQPAEDSQGHQRSCHPDALAKHGVPFDWQPNENGPGGQEREIRIDRRWEIKNTKQAGREQGTKVTVANGQTIFERASRPDGRATTAKAVVVTGEIPALYVTFKCKAGGMLLIIINQGVILVEVPSLSDPAVYVSKVRLVGFHHEAMSSEEPHPVMYEADKCVTTAESRASSVNTLSKGLLTFIDSGQRNVFHSMTLSKYSATVMAATILALALLTLLLDF
ncbi:hypothetical protein D9C73_011065 [Collichthys lucidus]|uniref:Uncharacterized protein n=1 Tax=Collichthys lucidus TaxID=240159 RepID=A0A4U5UTK6_COLLU|nr:hypothetical protein D9C73_011065 [Collichthys lucidus]